MESRPNLFEIFYLLAEEEFLRFEEVVGAKGFDPWTSWSRTRNLNPINALFGVAYGTRSRYSPLSVVPKLYLDFWGRYSTATALHILCFTKPPSKGGFVHLNIDMEGQHCYCVHQNPPCPGDLCKGISWITPSGPYHRRKAGSCLPLPNRKGGK
jgi:hypothetical protein